MSMSLGLAIAVDTKNGEWLADYHAAVVCVICVANSTTQNFPNKIFLFINSEKIIPWFKNLLPKSMSMSDYFYTKVNRKRSLPIQLFMR